MAKVTVVKPRTERIQPGIWRLKLPCPWPGVPHGNAWAAQRGAGIVLFDTGVGGPGRLRMLDVALAEFGVADLSGEEKDWLALGWRRLPPWPDTVAGMTRLKRKFTLAALSNGNIALITEMAKRGGLPWDVILGADLVQTYKPMPALYDSAPRLLDVKAGEVMVKRWLLTSLVLLP